MRSEDASRKSHKLSISTIRISIADMVALRVRTAEPGNPPPRYLYQQLPPEAIALIATIPSQTSAVSIPQQNGRYPISKDIPAERHDSCVIVYEHKPNRRYEAIKVLRRHESFDIARFYEMACRWAGNNLGHIHRIPGKYSYFAPNREQWGVILRDGGITVSDPSNIVLEITPEILRTRANPSTSGLIARAPVYSPPVVFAEVELTMDPHPGPECRWIDFAEFQRTRTARSRPPGPVIPLFRQWTHTLVAESGFKSWIFRKGMFFGNRTEWWGDKNRRRTTHEGIDFVGGILPDGTIRNIQEGTPIRAMANGEVVAILDDFLNKTLIVRHSAIGNTEGSVFHTLYSHIYPGKNPPGTVTKGQVLGRVEKSKKAGVPPHVHLTGAWIPESFTASEITLDMISASFAPIVLINFNSLLIAGGQSAVGDRQ